MIMIVFALAAFAIDRAVKIWAHNELRNMAHGTMPVFEGVLNLTYATNDGVSFGMFGGNVTLITIITAAMLVAVLVAMLLLRGKPFLLRTAGWIALGAAFGNLYDRIRFGFVIDMIEIRLFRFAIFNVADALLCLGVSIVALYVLFSKPKAAR